MVSLPECGSADHCADCSTGTVDLRDLSTDDDSRLFRRLHQDFAPQMNARPDVRGGLRGQLAERSQRVADEQPSESDLTVPEAAG